MKLSIIIVSWNVKDDLINCLFSIEENKPPVEFETIVVDNASKDGTVEALKNEFPKAIVIANSNNRGFAAANNQGIKTSKGDYVLLLNPDTTVHSNSLENMINFLDKNPDVGACGPKFLEVNGRKRPPVCGVPTFRGMLYGKTIFRSFGFFRQHYKKLKDCRFDPDKRVETNQLTGAAVMVRRSTIEQIGLMDDSFFMYYEDIDLFLRIRKAGWKLVYLPDSIITHAGGKSSSQVPAKKRIMIYRSLFIFFRKHRGKLPTWFFGLIFKPAAALGEIVNVLSSLIILPIFVLSFNRKKQLKYLTKIKDSTFFLWNYSWQLLFKI